MADKKLSQLPVGAAVVGVDLFYSAQSLGGGLYTQVQQPASAIFTYLAAAAAGSTVPLQRSVTASPIVIVASDQIINCNIASGSPTCTLPLASTRAGVALTFKDVGNRFSAHNLTLTPTAPDTIDGMSSYVLRDNYSGVRLVPLNDGVNSGWFIG